jgi:hypothetical protein
MAYTSPIQQKIGDILREFISCPTRLGEAVKKLSGVIGKGSYNFRGKIRVE